MLERDEPQSMFNLKFLPDSRHDRDDYCFNIFSDVGFKQLQTLMSELHNYVQLNINQHRIQQFKRLCCHYRDIYGYNTYYNVSQTHTFLHFIRDNDNM